MRKVPSFPCQSCRQRKRFPLARVLVKEQILLLNPSLFEDDLFYSAIFSPFVLLSPLTPRLAIAKVCNQLLLLSLKNVLKSCYPCT